MSDVIPIPPELAYLITDFMESVIKFTEQNPNTVLGLTGLIIAIVVMFALIIAMFSYFYIWNVVRKSASSEENNLTIKEIKSVRNVAIYNGVMMVLVFLTVLVIVIILSIAAWRFKTELANVYRYFKEIVRKAPSILKDKPELSESIGKDLYYESLQLPSPQPSAPPLPSYYQPAPLPSPQPSALSISSYYGLNGGNTMDKGGVDNLFDFSIKS